MLIDIPALNQLDPRWKDKPVGHGPKTIGQWGCLLTAYQMLATHWGINHGRDLVAENAYYLRQGAFSENNLISMAMSKAYPTVVGHEGWLLRNDSRMHSRTLDYLAAGRPVPARVDFRPETPNWEQHWVLLVGHDGTDYLMNDPWLGRQAVRVSAHYGIAGSDVLECLYYYKHDQPLPPDPPPSGHRAIVVKAPQEVTALEWRAIADYSLQFKHTMTASHDDTITVLRGGNSSSYAKIAYHTRASQQATIAQLDALGLSWQPVVIGDAPPAPEPPVPPPPPPVTAYTMFPFVYGDGRLYEVKNASGSHERFQSQGNTERFYQTKNRHWEEMWVSGGFVWRGIDTSPGGGRFYELTEVDNRGSAWIPASWRVGETFTRSRRVQFYRCENGQRVAVADNSGQVTDTMRFVAHHASYTFRTGIVLEDVVELLWVNGGERYFYAKGFGLVGWERQHQDPNTPAWSAISGIHEAGQRPDNEREGIC